MTTVVRRGQQLLGDGIVRVTAAPALGSRGRYDNFFVRIGCRPGTQVAVAEMLVQRADVRFCALVTGEQDIVAELVVDGGAATYPQLLTGLRGSAEIERWRSTLIMHVYKSSSAWGLQLFDETFASRAVGDGPDRPGQPATCEPGHLDDADWRIVDVLSRDGRQTFQSVADQVGLSESSVRRRFERLRSTGCLEILVLVPSSVLGMEAETLMTIQVEPAAHEAVVGALVGHPSVRYLGALLDQNALLCEVITPTAAELYEFATGYLSALPGVQGWSASVELVNLKRGFVETPWWRQLTYQGQR